MLTEISTEPSIRVGLITRGHPLLSSEGELTRVRNLLIGDGFHWMQVVDALFEGTVSPLAAPAGNIHAINTLPLESYLKSVTGSEMNPDAPMEFLKAHAVISRSWAITKILHSGKDSDAGKVNEPERIVNWEDAGSHTGFDVCSDDHCQRYQGIPAGNARRAMEAVDATRGMVLTDPDGKVADARFSKCCGGMTEIFSSCWGDEDIPYLTSHPDPYCALSKMNEDERECFLSSSLKGYDREPADPMHWQSEITFEEIADNLQKKFGRNIGRIREVTAATRSKAGRIVELRLIGEKGEMTVGKELMVRRLLSATHLYSSMIDLTPVAGGLRIAGRGWGHGVGLCQIGAARMALDGHDFRNILEFYYPTAKLTELYD